MLHAFKSLPVAREIHRVDSLPERAAGYARDTITLAWEDRVRARGRRRSDRGIEFGTALDRGTVLRDGAAFVLDQLRTVVAVAERPEPVFVVTPQSPPEWALFGYHLGNSHQPVMISDAGIVCPDTPGMRELLEYHRIPFTRALRPFTPVSLNPPAHQHQR